MFLEHSSIEYLHLAPQDVGPPTADAGVSYLNVKWGLPGQKNGIITGFILYHDGQQIYSGAQRNFNLTGLQVQTVQSL